MNIGYIISGIFAFSTALLMFILNRRSAINDKMLERIEKIEVSLPEKYVLKSDYKGDMDEVKKKLDCIMDILLKRKR